MKTYIRLIATAIIIISATGTAFCQSATDTTREDLGRIFIRQEVNPSFAKGEDSLSIYLQQNINTSHAAKKEEGWVKFIVSSRGNIYEVTRLQGKLSFEDELKSALLKSSGQWNSGLQNNYHINAYCSLKITLRNNKIKATIE